MIHESVFKDEIKAFTLFHIPHSSIIIPDYSNFHLNKVEYEIKHLTDFATDEIFDVKDIEKIVFPYSRIYCDVERLLDDSERMYQFGRGIYYTKCDNGDDLRELDDSNKKFIIEKIYHHHHSEFSKMVDDRLKKYGTAVIIDCHSFSDIPFESDLDKQPNRPDICIGTDDFHTPEFLLNLVKYGCKEFNFSFKINSPYQGTIVPMKYYRKADRVLSIMIEINRKLYINNGLVDNDKVKLLNNFINKIFNEYDSQN